MSGNQTSPDQTPKPEPTQSTQPLEKPWTRIYQFLVDEEDARVCKDISDSACQVVPGNFLLMLLAQFVTKLSDTLASTKLVVPWLLGSAGVPAFFSGLLVPIRESGSLLPQLAIAGVMRRFARRKWFLVLGGGVQAVGLVLMAVIATTMTGAAAGWAIVGTLVLVSLARGCSSVASKDVVGKTVPKTRRGALTGYGATASGLVVLAFGVLLALGLIGKQQSADVFLWLAAALALMAAGVYILIQEYPGATDGGGSALVEAFKKISLLRNDKDFRRFITVRALMMSSGLVAPFVVLMAEQELSLQGLKSLGLFLLVSGLASTASGVVWGKAADTSSRNVMLMTAAASAFVCLIGAGLSLLQAPPLWSLLVLYFLLSIVHEGVRVGRKTYVLDLAGGEKRTDYVAVGNTLIGVLLLLVGLFSAVLANVTLTWAFVLFAAMSACGCLLAIKLPNVEN